MGLAGKDGWGTVTQAWLGLVPAGSEVESPKEYSALGNGEEVSEAPSEQGLLDWTSVYFLLP